MKIFFTSISLLITTCLFAQNFDSLYVHLYTDSLKKGTYNYINIDGKLPNGHFRPLDSTTLIFLASDGKFYGNSLWLPKDFSKNKVTVKVMLREDHNVCQQFDIYVKQAPFPELMTEEELLKKMKKENRKKRS